MAAGARYGNTEQVSPGHCPAVVTWHLHNIWHTAGDKRPADCVWRLRLIYIGACGLCRLTTKVHLTISKILAFDDATLQVVS